MTMKCREVEGKIELLATNNICQYTGAKTMFYLQKKKEKNPCDIFSLESASK